MNWWFQKNNYPTKWLPQSSLDCIEKVREKYRLLAIEAKKPKKRKARKNKNNLIK